MFADSYFDMGLIGRMHGAVFMRHHQRCRPGMWVVTHQLSYEACEFMGIASYHRHAVVDDFGNLVAV